MRKDLEAGFAKVIFCVESEEVEERLRSMISQELLQGAKHATMAMLEEFV